MAVRLLRPMPVSPERFGPACRIATGRKVRALSVVGKGATPMGSTLRGGRRVRCAGSGMPLSAVRIRSGRPESGRVGQAKRHFGFLLFSMSEI